MIPPDLESPVVLPFISPSDTYGYDAVTLAETDDGVSGAITIPASIGFAFGTSTQTTVYVSQMQILTKHRGGMMYLFYSIGWYKWSDII